MSSSLVANSRQRYVLITGVSGGFGSALAERFHEAGYIIIGSGRRKPETGAALWQYLSDFLEADLALSTGAKELAEAYKSKYPQLNILINNAGIGVYGGWDEIALDSWERLMEVDLLSPVRLTLELMEVLKNSGGGVINISSVAGLAPVPGMGAYSTAKFGITAFSESLHMELKRFKLPVLTVYPGRISTPFGDNAQAFRPSPSTPGRNSVTADDLARAILNSWRKGRRNLIFPWWYRYFIWFTRLCPGIYGKAALKVWKF